METFSGVDLAPLIVLAIDHADDWTTRSSSTCKQIIAVMLKQAPGFRTEHVGEEFSV